VDIFVSFKDGVKDIIESIEETRFDTDNERRMVLRQTLLDRATSSQLTAKQYLNSGGLPLYHVSLWITNQLYVKAASVQDIYALATLDDVSAVDEEAFITLDDPTPDSDVIYGRPNPEAEWGIKKIQAEEAHALLRNATNAAAEIRIATIDTGARYTHEALKDNYLGTYGWYDPYDKTPAPIDNNGHGTHTTGTIAGKFGIGVYPDAKWLACRGCATSACSQFALVECAQFVACPTLPNGNTPDCTKAPHVVSNSWGGGRGNMWYEDAVAGMRAARVIVLFSQGNSGPSCNTANSPGDYKTVIGVGSTTVDDAISSFSSVGPTTDGRMKPDISAPGSNVLSAYNTADDAYRALSGTSMACPHAAGLVALLRAYKEDLLQEEASLLMLGGTHKDLDHTGRTCEGVPDDRYPNHVFGHGRINAFTSLKTLIDSGK